MPLFKDGWFSQANRVEKSVPGTKELDLEKKFFSSSSSSSFSTLLGMQKDQAACTTGTTYWLECPNTTHIVCFSSNNKIPKNQIPSQKNTPKPCIAAGGGGGGSCSTSYTINQQLNLPSPTRISPLLLFASSITHTQYTPTILFFSLLLLLLLQNATTLIQNHLHDLLSKLSYNPKSPPPKKNTHNTTTTTITLLLQLLDLVGLLIWIATTKQASNRDDDYYEPDEGRRRRRRHRPSNPGLLLLRLIWEAESERTQIELHPHWLWTISRLLGQQQ